MARTQSRAHSRPPLLCRSSRLAMPSEPTLVVILDEGEGTFGGMQPWMHIGVGWGGATHTCGALCDGRNRPLTCTNGLIAFFLKHCSCPSSYSKGPLPHDCRTTQPRRSICLTPTCRASGRETAHMAHLSNPGRMLSAPIYAWFHRGGRGGAEASAAV